MMYGKRYRQTSIYLRKRNEGQGTRARAEQNQAPPAENLVVPRVAEGNLRHPRQGTMLEGNPDPGPRGITKQGVVPEGPPEELQEVGNLRRMAPTDKGDGGPALAPRNRRRRVPLPAAERHQEETRLRRSPPTSQASLAVRLQTRPTPIKSRG